MCDTERSIRTEIMYFNNTKMMCNTELTEVSRSNASAPPSTNQLESESNR